MSYHTCMKCFRDMTEHEDKMAWPARCCFGCGCDTEQPEPGSAAEAAEYTAYKLGRFDEASR